MCVCVCVSACACVCELDVREFVCLCMFVRCVCVCVWPHMQMTECYEAMLFPISASVLGGLCLATMHVI